MGATSMRRTIHMSCLYPPNDQICREIARLGFNIIISKNSSDILIWAKLFSKERHFHLSFLVIIFHHFRVECSHQFLIINRQFVSKFHIPNFWIQLWNQNRAFQFQVQASHNSPTSYKSCHRHSYWLLVELGQLASFWFNPKYAFFPLN